MVFKKNIIKGKYILFKKLSLIVLVLFLSFLIIFYKIKVERERQTEEDNKTIFKLKLIDDPQNKENKRVELNFKNNF